MSCDCIERIEASLTETMKKQFPNGEVINGVTFQNKTLIYQIEDNKTKIILSNPTLGRIKIGKSIRKFEYRALPEYCPYCGKPLNDNQEGGKQ